MPDRRHIVPIPFGPGIARNEGSMIVREGALEDARNFYLLDGRLQTRWGFDLASTLPGELGESGTGTVTHILGGQALRSERIGLVVGYSRATRRVGVWRVNGAGERPEYLGHWFTHHKDDAPIIHVAEVNGQVFFAHDEPLLRRRATTIGYGGFGAQALFLDELTMDEGESVGTALKFRGVVRHLDYLVGWGFGTLEEDRPEFVRISRPGEPTNFPLQGYMIAGNRRDPVWRCIPGESDLIVYKETETHVIRGTSRANFGIFLLEPGYGILAPRLAVHHSGRVFFWSNEGPRMSDGFGPSVSVELPLDLQGFEPDDLVSQAPLREAFATYVPGDRMVWFVFGRRVYSLTVRRDGDWKWGYHELGFQPLCAFTLWSESDIAPGLTAAPEGYPEFTAATPAGTYADLVWTHVDVEGDEILEVWLKLASSDTWTREIVEPVSAIATQETRVEGLTEGQTYDVAARYTRGGQAGEAYTDPDPANWPSVSQGQFTTTLDPPLLGVYDEALGWYFASPGTGLYHWERQDGSNHRVQFRIFPQSDEPGHLIRVYVSEDFGAITLVQELTEGVDFDLGSLDADGGFLFEHANPTQNVILTYRAVSRITVSSPWSPILRTWAGPIPEAAKSGAGGQKVPKTFFIHFASNRRSYEISVTPHKLQEGPIAGASTVRLFDNWNDAGSSYNGTPDQDRGTFSVPWGAHLPPEEQGPPSFGAAGITLLAKIGSGTFANALPSGSQVQIGLQFEATRFAVTDESELIIINSVVP